MATFTSNYGLHQWAPEDNFLRTDFNQDLEKIDTALAEKANESTVTSLQSQVDRMPGIVVGSYTGNGGTQTITLGFMPRLVLTAGGMNLGAATIGSGHPMISITGTGFTLTHLDHYGNSPNDQRSYGYLAIR